MKRAVWTSALVFGCVGCDQGTKRLATYALRGEGLTYFGGMLRLFYAENTGAFGSLGAGWPSSLKLLAFIVLPLGVLGYIGFQALRSQPSEWLGALAGALIVGGGIGNILDRVISGRVVDFILVRVGGVGTNVFNVADVAVMAGVGLMVVDALRRRPAATPASP